MQGLHGCCSVLQEAHERPGISRLRIEEATGRSPEGLYVVRGFGGTIDIFQKAKPKCFSIDYICDLNLISTSLKMQ